MVDTRYRRNAGSVYSPKYHLIWCPKYRRKVLVGDIAKELRTLLYQKAQDLGVEIVALEIMPNHVHLFIESAPTEAPQHLTNQFKGHTSRMLRLKFPELRSRLPNMWSRSYYVGSIGDVSKETVRRYIEMQRWRWPMIRVYKYRLRPDSKQFNRLDYLLLQHRSVYNAAPQQRIAVYRGSGRGVKYAKQSRHFLGLRRNNPETLGQANASSLQQTLRRLDKAFSAFLRRLKEGNKAGLPRFKSANRFRSIEFTYGDGYKLGQSGRRRMRFYTQNVGETRVCYHHAIPADAKIRHVIIRRANERWYVNIILEIPSQTKKRIPTGNRVGIDVGLKNLIALSTGELIETLRRLKKSLAKPRRLQCHASRQIKGPNRQRKTYRQIARLHEKIANQWADYLHKVSHWLITNNDLIAIEDPALGFMNKNRHLSRSSYDAGFGLFRRMLEYKAESAGVQVVAVDPPNTTQACSKCGSIVPKGLSARVHKCHHCGLVIDRDVNAARNILHMAMYNPLGQSGQEITQAVAPSVA